MDFGRITFDLSSSLKRLGDRIKEVSVATQFDPVDRYEETHEVREPGVDREETYVRDVAAERRQTLYQISALIGFFFGILEGLIGIRILLRLIGANPQNPFASLVYNFTALFLAPFNGLVPTPAAGPLVLEVSSLIAILVYALVAWAIIRLIWLLFDQPGARSVSRYERNSTRVDKY